MNNKHTIIEEFPFSYPLRISIYMLTSISIPDNYMCRIFYRSQISKKEKCMLSRESSYRSAILSMPWNYSIFCTSITDIFCWDWKKSENIIIDFCHYTIFITWWCTPVSPKNNMRSHMNCVESLPESINWHDIHISSIVWDTTTQRYACKVFCKW